MRKNDDKGSKDQYDKVGCIYLFPGKDIVKSIRNIGSGQTAPAQPQFPCDTVLLLRRAEAERPGGGYLSEAFENIPDKEQDNAKLKEGGQETEEYGKGRFTALPHYQLYICKEHMPAGKGKKKACHAAQCG